jgi:hypothetical protein
LSPSRKRQGQTAPTYHTYATLIKRGSRQSLKLDEGSRCVAPSAVPVVAGFKPLSCSVPGSDICGLWSIVSGATGVIAWDSIQEACQCQRGRFFHRIVFLASLDCILGITHLPMAWLGRYLLTLVAVGNLLTYASYLPRILICRCDWNAQLWKARCIQHPACPFYDSNLGQSTSRALNLVDKSP